MDHESLRAILAKRTPGEWVVCGGDQSDIGAIAEPNFPGGILIASCNNTWLPKCKSNAAAIVAAVNAIGPLLERVQSLEAKLEQLERKRPWIEEAAAACDNLLSHRGLKREFAAIIQRHYEASRPTIEALVNANLCPECNGMGHKSTPHQGGGTANARRNRATATTRSRGGC